MSTGIRFYIGVLTALLLSGCLGGNNSATGPVTSTLSFPLQGAFKSLVANGFAGSTTISGTSLAGNCSGTGTQSIAPAVTAAIFAGVAGFSAVDSSAMKMENCSVTSIASIVTNYYDANYTPLGYDNAGVEFGVYVNQPSIPASVIIGDAGPIGTVSLYTDSTKSTGSGRIDVTYKIEADTAITAIVNFVFRRYDATGTVLSTEQDRYRLGSTGALIPISSILQEYASTLSLTSTYN